MKHIIITAFLFSVSQMGIGQGSYDTKLTNNIGAQADEGEAHIAINPTDSNEMVLGFMDLDNTVAFRIYNSSDGGSTWQESTFQTDSIVSTAYPGHSIAGGGDILFAYDKNGKLYCSWIFLIVDNNSSNPFDSALFAGFWASSLDNGNTFSFEPGINRHFGLGKIDVIAGTIHNYEQGICDRQWMAVDLSDGPNQNNLYVGFVNYTHNAATFGLKVRTKEAGQDTLNPLVTAFSGLGQFTNLQVDRSGTLHYSFCDIANNSIMHVSSTDGGQSFSAPHLISNALSVFPNSNYHVNERENAAPSLALDSSNNLHVVWNDFPPSGSIQAFYSKSEDGGLTWSSPLDLTSVFPGEVFMPTLSAHNNRVTIGANVLDSTSKSNYHIITSSDNGNLFGYPLKVSSDFTDFQAVGQTPFLGDYSSGARTNCFVYSLWTDCRANGCKQYVAKVDECSMIGIPELTPIQANFEISNMYPVPAETQLTIEINSVVSDDYTLEILDVQGKLVKSISVQGHAFKNDVVIPIQELTSGQYVLHVRNSAGTFVSRHFSKH